MSDARRPGCGVRLHEIVTVTGPRSGRTLTTTKSGPIAKSGCGREARKTWASAAAGALTTRSSARRPKPRRRGDTQNT
jgi:hypothetical protein